MFPYNLNYNLFEYFIKMPTQKEIKRMARRRGISEERMARMVFGRMRKLGWRPSSQGGPTKRWKRKK